MTVSPETLLAFVEGELSPEEARRVAAQVANDPSLAAHVENHKALKARLQAASMVPISTEGMPIAHSPEPAGTISRPRPEAGSPKPERHGSAHWITAGAMAIGIGLGVLLALSLRPGTEIRSADGAVVAQGSLEQALSNTIGVEQDSAAPAKIGESFFSSDGYFCRNFTTADAKGALAGIACREGQEWRIRVLASAEPPDPKTQEAKATALPVAVRETLDSLMVGQPLDAEGERTARAQSWLVR